MEKFKGYVPDKSEFPAGTEITKKDGKTEVKFSKPFDAREFDQAKASLKKTVNGIKNETNLNATKIPSHHGGDKNNLVDRPSAWKDSRDEQTVNERVERLRNERRKSSKEKEDAVWAEQETAEDIDQAA